MPSKKLNKNHELDLEFLKKFGNLENNEIPLSQTEFLVDEEVQKSFQIYSKMFLVPNESKSKEIKE